MGDVRKALKENLTPWWSVVSNICKYVNQKTIEPQYIFDLIRHLYRCNCKKVEELDPQLVFDRPFKIFKVFGYLTFNLLGEKKDFIKWNSEKFCYRKFELAMKRSRSLWYVLSRRKWKHEVFVFTANFGCPFLKKNV